MPADPRRLAQEAIELAAKATPGKWLAVYAPGDVRKPDRAGWPTTGVPICAVALRQRVYSDMDGGSFPAADQQLIAHAGTHYATIARALIEALDRAEQYQRDWYAAKSDFGDAMAKERGEVRAITADRDALLADLPHVLETCRCPRTWLWQLGTHGKWPEAHTAAIARLEARIK